MVEDSLCANADTPACDTDPFAEPSSKATESIGSSAVFFAIGLYMAIGGLRMPTHELTGSPDKWYSAPGLFPMFIGAGLMVMSAGLIAKTLLQCRESGDGFTLAKLIPGGKNGETSRLLCAAALLVLFVASLGTVNFSVATFLYLLVTMLCFRAGTYAIWKMILIAVLFSIAVTYGFGTLARIPLP